MPATSHILETISLTPRGVASPAVTADDADRARLVAQLRDRHRTMLWLSAFVIVAAFALRIRDSETVGPISLPQLSLPALCGSRALFGVECPGCGLTRSFIALASGDLAESIRYHRVGWVLALAVLLQIPYRLFSLRELRTRIPCRSWPTWFGHLLIGLLIVNWLFKVSHLY